MQTCHTCATEKPHLWFTSQRQVKLHSSKGALQAFYNLDSVYVELSDLPSDTPAHRLSELTTLTQLHLESNYLSGYVPAQLSTLTALVECDLSDNLLNGTLPYALVELSRTATLNVDSNIGLCGSLSAFYTLSHARTGLNYPCPSYYERECHLLGVALCA